MKVKKTVREKQHNNLNIKEELFIINLFSIPLTIFTLSTT